MGSSTRTRALAASQKQHTELVTVLRAEPALILLRNAALRVAEPLTSCHPYEYPAEAKRCGSVLWGHCAAVAYTVHAVFGGDIVTGRVKGIQHYWNRLPKGLEIDLTSCQFGGDGFTPLAKGRSVKPRKTAPLRFIIFADRIRTALQEER